MCRRQHQVLGTPKLTFENAVNIATAIKVAKRNLKQIKNIGMPQDEPTSVHKLQKEASDLEPPTRTRVMVSKHIAKKGWTCDGSLVPETCTFGDTSAQKQVIQRADKEPV